MATRTLENVTVSDAYMFPPSSITTSWCRFRAAMASASPRREVLPALERAMKAVLVEKRQALLNVVCDVDANAGGD